MEKLSKISIFLLLGIIFVATSCYYDNEEYLYPTVNTVRECDTVVASYSLHVAPIITSKCLVCHSTSAAPNAGGNIILEGYINLQKIAITGKLLGSVSHTPGYSPMPKGGNKLSYCELSYIRRWIEGNTANN